MFAKGNTMLMRKLGVALLACLALNSGFGHVIAAEAKGKDIVETAVAAGSFKTLAAALKAAGLVEVLQGKGPFTVFAPTDEAFAKLPEGTVETLLKPENKKQLVAILTYHVVAGLVPAAEVVKLNAAIAVNGQRIDIKTADGQVFVDQAKVVKADIPCSNGVIHVIDQVLLPSSDNIPTTAEKAGKFKTLLAAAKAAGLVDALSGDSPLTIFAPTDEAFAALPPGTVESLLKPENKDKLVSILKFHVIPGRVYSDTLVKGHEVKTLQGSQLAVTMKDGKAKVLNAGIVKTDIDASNGVIHVIDAVLMPPTTTKGAAIMRVETQHVAQACPSTGRQMAYYSRPRRHR